MPYIFIDIEDVEKHMPGFLKVCNQLFEGEGSVWKVEIKYFIQDSFNNGLSLCHMYATSH